MTVGRWSSRIRARLAVNIAAILISLITAGCAEKGPVLVNAVYQIPGNLSSVTSASSVAVNEFRDVRGKPASVVGSRTIPDGRTDDIVVPGTASDLVAALVQQALRARGVAARRVTGWDLTAEGTHVAGAPIVIGGEIRTLWLDSRPSGLNTKAHAVVNLRIVAGDAEARQIIRSIDVNSRIDQEILYSQERLQSILAETLSSAIDQLFADAVLKARL